MHRLNMRPMAAGRVLSAENESRIREARDGLDSVLSKLAQEPADSLHVNRLALKPGVVRVNAEDGATEAEVLIYGDIGGGWYDEGITAESISKEITALDVETLNVRINSGGGLVFEGIAIYNAIARHKAKVVIHIDGIAASIASVIAMAGDEIRISEGSHLMIHKPWSFAMGDAPAMRKEADILDQLEGGIIDIYAARTDRKRAELEKWVAAETWFTGQAAVDAGFADEMVPAKKKKPANSALLNLFKNAPQNLLTDSEHGSREFESFLRDGEGLSHAQAKRIAFAAVRRTREEPAKPPRDEGGERAERLAQRISQFTKSMKG
jgi:ATP-dependent Clp protease protease subunit